MWKYLNTALKAVGAMVDAVVPVGVGSRTAIAVVACPLLGVLAPVIASIPGGNIVLPVIPILQHILCTSATAFAVAGLARKV